MALRRWKPFLGAFDHIDAAIESASAAAGVGPDSGIIFISRGEFKRARNRIVETLCGATDDGVAEALCLLLDEAMAESLVTLRMAHAEKKKNLDLLASGELVAAVGALARGHASPRVRGLARGLVRGWRAAVEEDLATARAAMHALDAASAGLVFDGRSNDRQAEGKKQSKIPEKPPCPRKPLLPVFAGGGRLNSVKTDEPAPKKMPLFHRGGCAAKTTSPNTKAARKVPALRPKMASPPAARRAPTSSCCAEDETKMEATKRKLHERYQEADDAKRRRTIQVLVVAPEMRRQHKTRVRP